MAAIPSYRAEMIGLSERDRTLLRSFLAASQARTGVRWDGGPGQPAVSFIDVDGQEGADFWQSLGAEERRDAAVVISALQPPEGVRWLPKPLRSSALIGVLETMVLPVRAPSAAPAPKAAPSAPASRQVALKSAAPRPDGAQDLLDILDGQSSTTARAVQSAHWPDIVLGGSHTHAMRTAPLESYADGFAASLEVGRVAKYTGGPLDDELRIDLGTLRWLALLYAPIAEVERRLPYPGRVRLSKLPAFGQLPHKLHHVRMAAWLVQHPATAEELADMVAIDEESVQRFLGACAAVGLLEDAPEEALAPQPVTPSAPHPVTQPVTPSAPARAMRELIASAPAAAPAAETIVDEAPPTPDEAPVAADAANGGDASEAADAKPAPAEPVSVLERLRASREQNRARVAAAIREISNS